LPVENLKSPDHHGRGFFICGSLYGSLFYTYGRQYFPVANMTQFGRIQNKSEDACAGDIVAKPH
jgi:hypothetical protein